MGEENSSFHFPYKLGDERNCIVKTEKELRYLIDTIMTNKYGALWLSNPSLGVRDYASLQNRQQDDIKKFPDNSAEGTNLIEYCYIHELKEIIEKNWNTTLVAFFTQKVGH
jgi:hypothetical protein